MSGSDARVRVMVWVRGEQAGVQRAYHEISKALAGTPGLLGNELMCAIGDPDAAVVMSEWASMDAFRRWESGDTHRQTTAPLRPFQDRRRDGAAFAVYQVSLAY